MASLSGTVTVHAVTDPVVGSISPSSGSASGGALVRVSGSGFRPAEALRCVFSPAEGGPGRISAPASFVDAYTVMCEAPAVSPGAYNVSVTLAAPEKAAGASGVAYTARPEPTLTSVSPGAGPVEGGTPVVLLGSGFVVGARTDCVFGDATVPARVESPSRVACTGWTWP